MSLNNNFPFLFSVSSHGLVTCSWLAYIKGSYNRHRRISVELTIKTSLIFPGSVVYPLVIFHCNNYGTIDHYKAKIKFQKELGYM